MVLFLYDPLDVHGEKVNVILLGCQSLSKKKVSFEPSGNSAMFTIALEISKSLR